MRSTDGTFIDHLADVLRHVAESDLDEQRRFDLAKTISFYCTLAAKATSEKIKTAIPKVFKGQEYLNMIEGIMDRTVIFCKVLKLAKQEAKSKVRSKPSWQFYRLSFIPCQIQSLVNSTSAPTRLLWIRWAFLS